MRRLLLLLLGSAVFSSAFLFFSSFFLRNSARFSSVMGCIKILRQRSGPYIGEEMEKLTTLLGGIVESVCLYECYIDSQMNTNASAETGTRWRGVYLL
jgi:hypothetical protein